MMMKKILCYQQQLIFSLILGVLGLVDTDAFGFSNLVNYGGVNAEVKDGKPCFYLKNPINSNEYYINTITVVPFKADNGHSNWHRFLDKGHDMGYSKETCIPYGSGTPTENSSILELMRMYEVRMFGYGLDASNAFCLQNKKDGNFFVTKTEIVTDTVGERVRKCASEPLNDEDKPPSLWQRIFEK